MASLSTTSSAETPNMDVDDVETDNDYATFQTYIDAAPYPCESPRAPEILAKLEQIISKMHICIKAKNWIVLSTWDGVLECWLLMRYPIPKPIRAKLVRLYYELILLPGIEARTCRNWIHMFNRVLANKPGNRKLEPTDLQLPWQPLWRIVKKELWPSGRKRSDLG